MLPCRPHSDRQLHSACHRHVKPSGTLWIRSYVNRLTSFRCLPAVSSSTILSPYQLLLHILFSFDRLGSSLSWLYPHDLKFLPVIPLNGRRHECGCTYVEVTEGNPMEGPFPNLMTAVTLPTHTTFPIFPIRSLTILLTLILITKTLNRDKLFGLVYVRQRGLRVNLTIQLMWYSFRTFILTFYEFISASSA